MSSRGVYTTLECVKILLKRFDPIVLLALGLSIGLLSGKYDHWLYVAFGFVCLSIILSVLSKKYLWLHVATGTICGLTVSSLADRAIILPANANDVVANVKVIQQQKLDRYRIYLDVIHAGVGPSIGIGSTNGAEVTSDLLDADNNLKGKQLILWVNQFPFEVKVGDIVRAQCTLEGMDDSVPWEKAWLSKGIVAKAECSELEAIGQMSGLEKIRLDTRGFVVSIVEKHLKPPHSSLLLGMLAGDDTGMPKKFNDKMRNVGLTHIIVVSGYNITVVYEAIRKALFFLGRKYTDIIGALGLSVFVWIVGGEPPVLRAMVMAWMCVLARVFGRSITPMRALFASAVVLIVLQPSWVESASLHLSFLATFAMIKTNDVTPAFLDRIGKTGEFVKEYVLRSLVVLSFTLTYCAVFFGELSLVSIVSNIFVLPVIESVMLLGTLGIVGSLFADAVGRVLFAIAWTPLWYITLMADKLSVMASPSTVDINQLYILPIFTLLATAGLVCQIRKLKLLSSCSA